MRTYLAAVPQLAQRLGGGAADWEVRADSTPGDTAGNAVAALRCMGSSSLGTRGFHCCRPEIPGAVGPLPTPTTAASPPAQRGDGLVNSRCEVLLPDKGGSRQQGGAARRGGAGAGGRRRQHQLRVGGGGPRRQPLPEAGPALRAGHGLLGAVSGFPPPFPIPLPLLFTPTCPSFRVCSMSMREHMPAQPSSFVT